MKSEHVKLIVGAGVLVVAIGIYWFFGRSSEPLRGSVEFVCVATGKIYPIAQDKMPSILPAKNPDTGSPTLLPCEKVDGKLVVMRRHAYLLREPELEKANKYVDPQTLEVRTSPRP